MPEQLPNNESAPVEPEAQMHRSHTYEDDVTRAMNTTDATVVQELLAEARNREAAELEYRTRTSQKKWYVFFSFLCMGIALAAFGYALWHYSTLTVPVERNVSIGVFPTTIPIVAEETDIRKTLSTLAEHTDFPDKKPLLVPIVADRESLVPISKEAFFQFIESAPTEPFLHAIDTIRLGVVNDGGLYRTFIILSVRDPQLASKEFLIAEPTLLQLFYRPLGISLADHLAQVGKTFEGTYLYNLPVRVLSHTDAAGNTHSELLYGYASSNTLVITTTPSVLKAVYDTIVRQQ